MVVINFLSCSTCNWCPSSLFSTGYWRLYTGEVKLPHNAANFSPPSTAATYERLQLHQQYLYGLHNSGCSTQITPVQFAARGPNPALKVLSTDLQNNILSISVETFYSNNFCCFDPSNLVLFSDFST